MRKNCVKVAMLTILAIAILFVLPGMVNAAENVAKIGTTEYATLAEAVEAAPVDGTETTITLLRSVEDGTGFKVKAGQNIVIDFNNYTYDASNPLVGSTGTETNGCQLLKGSTVTFKNGTLESKAAAILIQNYCNLTLKDMVVDTTVGTAQYAVSNNCGKVNIIGNTSIKSNNYAFDMCWAPNKNYPEGTQVTVDTTGTISGDIELDVWGTYSDVDGIKSTLNIKNMNHVGKFVIDPKLANQLTIEGGTYTTDVKEHLGAGYAQVKVSDTEYKVGPKATGLVVAESLEMTIGDTKKLETTVAPGNTIEAVTYSSSDVNVATVDANGNIKAVKVGEAEITVTVGEISKKCAVKVIAKEIIPELPEIEENENIEEIQVGVAPEVKEEINEILKEEANSNEEVKNALEAGKEVKVEIKIENVAASEVNEEAKAKVEEFITEKEEIAQYFDISLLITADGEKIGEISEPSKKLTFKLAIPETLVKEGRIFYIIRVHEGKVEKIETTLEDNNLTFESDRFSTYALAYVDPVDETDDNNTEIPDNTEDNEKDETPTTGVASYIAIVAFVGTIALAGAVSLKKRK